ncbi:response regulator [Verrucomicrobiota bacterium]
MKNSEHELGIGLKYVKEPIPCDHQRLLIADDERVVRDVFKRIIKFNLPNCRIDLAVNGAEAVGSFREIHQRVILMDMKMPVMDGAAAFSEIMRMCETNNWEMPSVLFCTGYAPSVYIKNIIEQDSNHACFQKPIKNEVLLKAITMRLSE